MIILMFMCEIEVHTSEDNQNQNNRIEFNIFDANYKL